MSEEEHVENNDPQLMNICWMVKEKEEVFERLDALEGNSSTTDGVPSTVALAEALEEQEFMITDLDNRLVKVENQITEILSILQQLIN